MHVGQIERRVREIASALLLLGSVAPVHALTLLFPGDAQSTATDKLPAVPAGRSTLLYSAWVKICQKGPDQVCFTTANGRAENGRVTLSVMLIEPRNKGDKVLRVTLPLAMQLPAGTRLAVDDNQPVSAPYILCDVSGCMSDYAADSSLLEGMKSGQRLIIQAVERDGQTINFIVPLADFAIAYEGTPTDPKVFAEQQRDLQRQMQAHLRDKHQNP